MSKLKRLLTPKFWKIPKKVKKWSVSPRSGPHKKFECIPLLVIVRDILKLTDSGSEAKKIIKSGEILVDGKIRKDHAYPVGLMDVVSIPKIKRHLRIIPTSIGLELIEIPEKESKVKICKINDKTVVKKRRIQLNLHDGKNVLVEKDVYKTGDSVLIEVPSQKILDHIKLEKGNLGLITKGKNSGKIAKINKIILTKSMREPNKVICKIEKKEVEVMKEYILVVGKETPVIMLGE